MHLCISFLLNVCLFTTFKHMLESMIKLRKYILQHLRHISTKLTKIKILFYKNHCKHHIKYIFTYLTLHILSLNIKLFLLVNIEQ